MSKSNLRWAIILLSLATAAIHLSLNLSFSMDNMIFTLNGLGYLGLAALFYFDNPITRGRESSFHWVFMGYTAVTIIAYFAINGVQPLGSDTLGYATKLIEALLIGALWMHKGK
jgi:ABC-type microcin C transport system permease subunit YejB